MAGLDGTITVKTSEYRPCMVGDKRAMFHRWEDKAEIVPPSNLRGGHSGGVVRGSIAIVEFEDGRIVEVYPRDVRFLDSKCLFSEYSFQHHAGVTDDGNA